MCHSRSLVSVVIFFEPVLDVNDAFVLDLQDKG